MPQFPHRADHVGSLLRPARLAAARQSWRDGETSKESLTAIEDECIDELVARQEAIGIRAVTDGEFRRDWWHLDFLNGFEGIGLAQRERPPNFQGEGESPPIPVVVGKVRHTAPIFVDAFTYLASVTKQGCSQDHHPGPGDGQLHGRTQGHRPRCLPRHRGVLGRPRRRLQKRGRRVVRSGMSLPATRRRQFRLSL